MFKKKKAEVENFEPSVVCSHHLLSYIHCSYQFLVIKGIIHSFPDSSVGIESACQCRRPQFNSWIGKIHWRRDKLPTPVFLGFLCGSAGKESACNVGDLGLIPGWEDPQWLPIPVFSPGEFRGLYSPWDRKELGTFTSFHFSVWLKCQASKFIFKEHS